MLIRKNNLKWANVDRVRFMCNEGRMKEFIGQGAGQPDDK